MNLDAPSSNPRAAPDAAHPRHRVDGRPSRQQDDRHNALAWQREMERAQLSDWLRPHKAASVQPAGASPTSAAAGSRETPGEQAPPAPRLAAMKRHAGAAPVEVPDGDARLAPRWAASNAGSRASPSAPTSPYARRPGDPCRPTTTETHGSTPIPAPWSAAIRASASMPLQTPWSTHEAAAAPSSTASDAHAAVEMAPLRLHAEHGADGHAVWIAMRADDPASIAMLPRLVAELRRAFEARGERLHQVVCNGRLLWRDTPAGEPSISFTSPPGKEP